MNKRILVFGVSGIGKTTACQDYANHHKGVKHISAGKILSESDVPHQSSEKALGYKEILTRQECLSRKINQLEKEHPYKDFIIDAHSFVESQDTIVNIPTRIISMLKPSSIILLELDPESVLARIKDSSRKRPTHRLVELMWHIHITRINVVNYAREIEVPLKIIEADCKDCISAHAH